MKLNRCLSLCLILFCSVYGLKAQSKKIDYTKSSLSFKIKNAGLKVDGKFDNYRATLVFDAQNLSTTRIEGDVKTTSINTGINGRDNHLRKEEFFNVEKYPTIHYKVTSIKKQSSGDYLLYGKLTIKDVTKDVTMPLHITSVGSEEIYESSLTINRLDYHVGESSWVMSDEVSINIKIVTQ